MQAEIFALWGIFLLVMFGFAETNRRLRIIGVTASLLLIGTSLWVLNEGVSYGSGTETVISETQEVVGNITTVARNQTAMTVYVPVSTPYFDFKLMLGLAMLGCGMIGGLHYIAYVSGGD